MFSALLTLWLAVGTQLVLAQAAPPPPNATAQSVTTSEDTPITINTGITYDDRYQIVILSPGPAHGTAPTQNPAPGTPNPAPPTTFKIDYAPGVNQTSAVSFFYQLCTRNTNPVICGQSALVSVSITSVNDGPQAGPDSATLLFGESVLIPVLTNDNGGANENDSVALVDGSVTAPTDALPLANLFANDGTAVIENNQIRYTAPTNAAAGVNCPVAPNKVTFNYQVRDGAGNQATGTVTVDVKCPGSPTLKLGEPHSYSGHTFKIDVILESADANVFATDFYLTYDACLTDADSPSDSKIADDVTSNLTAAGFLFDVVDDTFATRRLHFFAAAALNPNLVLAGPGNTTRTLATLQFKGNPTPACAAPTFTLTNGAGGAPGFTGANAAPLLGTGTPKSLTLDFTKINSKPTNLSLNPVSVPENSPINTYVGTFATTDPDAGDTHTVNFEPVSPTSFGSSSNRFGLRIVNNQTELIVNQQSATEIASGVYSITLRTTDNYGASITRTFGINVTDVNKAPTANDDNNGNPAVGFTVPGFANIDVLANDTDGADFPAPVNAACPVNGCSVVSVTNGSKGIVINQGTNVRYIVTDPKFNGTDSLGGPFRDTFSYVMTDNDAPNALTASAKVTVTVAAEVYPAGHPAVPSVVGLPVKLGDCNGSGTVEAGDLTATGLEIFDGDGSLWYDIYKGTRTTFSPRGCNSNQDNSVDAGDISCTARKIFNAAATCGAVVASGASKATLEVASGLRGAAGSTVNVPVSLRNNGNAVDTAVFALAYDASKLSFNADDASAVSLSGGQLSLVNAADGRVEIVVTGLSAADGAVATIRLNVKADASGDAAISLADSSLGSEGGSVAVDTAGGAIQIGGAGSVSFRSLLPLIRK